MKEVVLRIDVDTPTGSLALNRLRLRFGYLHYLRNLISLLKEYQAKASFMFIPNRTTPTRDLADELRDLGCEIGVHADEVLSERLRGQREQFERIVGGRVLGITYHGRDLVDLVIHKLTRKNRYVAYHNPFVSLLAGFAYDATGFASGKPRFLRYGEEKILLFQSYRDITAGSLVNDVDPSWYGSDFTVLLIHPNYLDRYGFRKRRKNLVERVLDYARRNDIEFRTYGEVYERFSKLDRP